jgi:hypothetical protein
LVFESPTWFDATNATGDGIPLVSPWHGGEEAVLIIAGAPLVVETNKMYYCSLQALPACGQGQVEITVWNIGSSTIEFPNLQKFKITDASGSEVYPGIYFPTLSWLSPGQQQMDLWNQKDWSAGTYVPPGEYLITTVSSLRAEDQGRARFVLRDKGYFILVAGANDAFDNQLGINGKPSTEGGHTRDGILGIYEILRDQLGYSRDRIWYMEPCSVLRTYDKYPYPPCAPVIDASGKIITDTIADDKAPASGDKVPDNITTGELSVPPGVRQHTGSSLESALVHWASTRVSVSEPLFIVMYDHGFSGASGSWFSTYHINSDGSTSDSQLNIWAADLNVWLNTLEANTHASVYVIIDACHSGGFITGIGTTAPPDVLSMSEYGRLIITSSQENEYSYWTFTDNYWPFIGNGASLLDAFVEEDVPPVNVTPIGSQKCPTGVESDCQHPILDDNGELIGQGYDVPTGSAGLPHDGDGSLAMNVEVLDPGRVFPWIEYVQPKSTYAWPPSGPVTVWAEVESKISHLNVTAWMIPPDWVPIIRKGTVVGPTPLEPFRMSDLRGDGNFTVEIPAMNFTTHARGPTTFNFIVTAEDASGTWPIPRYLRVEFTANGRPSLDRTPPNVVIEFPSRGDILQGVVSINGTVTDDTRVSSAELIVDGSLIQTIDLPATSSSFFEFNLDTRTIQNGIHTFQVRAYDSSRNNATYTTVFWVLNQVTTVTTTSSLIVSPMSTPRLISSASSSFTSLTSSVTSSMGRLRIPWLPWVLIIVGISVGLMVLGTIRRRRLQRLRS